MAVPTLEIFNIRKEKAANIIKDSIKIYEFLGMKTNAEKATKAYEKIKHDDFKTIVLGEFKRGKSTFINALLEDEILPNFATPCTAVINEVKYGEKAKAVLHFKDPLPEGVNYSFNSDVAEHIRTHEGSKIPPMPIISDNLAEDLEKYVVIPDPAQDQEASVSESPYSKVELFYPIELCKNGVTIIDSPGLNEHGTRTKVTIDYLSQVDAILFVMSCQALCSKTEMEFIENKIKTYGHEDIFFICNRFDEVRENEKERLKSVTKARLAPLTSFGDSGVFFVSAADALDGILDEEPELLEKSGMIPFEERLSEFFANERGRIKLNQPLKEVYNDLKDVSENFIPGQVNMLKMSVADIEKKYEEAIPALQNAEKRKNQMIEKINIGREKIRQEVKTKLNTKLKELADKISEWGKNYEFKSSDEKSKAKELCQHINSCIENEIDSWSNSALKPIIDKHLGEIIKNVGDSHNLFNQELGFIKDNFFFPTASAEKSSVDTIATVSSFGGAFGGGFLVGMLGLSPILAPIAGIAGAAAAIVAVFSFFSDNDEDLKNKILPQIADDFRQKSSQTVDEVSDKVFQQTQVLADTVSEKLNEDINKITETVNSILAEKKKGEQEAVIKAQKLEQLKSMVDKKIEDISELIYETDQNKSI